jgi:hypothetical protein
MRAPAIIGAAALLILALGSAPLAAQRETGSTWVQWSTFDVFVAADTVRGMGLWLLPRKGTGIMPKRRARARQALHRASRRDRASRRTRRGDRHSRA